MADYHRPATLDEAIAIRAARTCDGAGRRHRRLSRPRREGLLGRAGAPARAGHFRHRRAATASRETAGEVRFGARATWSRIAEAHLPPLFDGLRHAARTVGGAQVQNRGTIAGNLCTASPAGDGIPNLLALDASVELAGPRDARIMPWRTS